MLRKSKSVENCQIGTYEILCGSRVVLLLSRTNEANSTLARRGGTARWYSALKAICTRDELAPVSKQIVTEMYGSSFPQLGTNSNSFGSVPTSESWRLDPDTHPCRAQCSAVVMRCLISLFLCAIATFLRFLRSVSSLECKTSKFN